MIVTIDGPAGAGKSLVARKLALRLGYAFLDTGAMYRAAALAAHRRGVDLEDESACAAAVRAASIEVGENFVALDGDDVTSEIRTSLVTSITRYAAGNPRIRQHLVDLQRSIVGARDYVTEGRDQGTVVFPDAEFKFYLTASPEDRARRRQRDLAARGENVALADVLVQQNERDASDASRDVGPLAMASDAIHFSTDNLTPDEVVDRLIELIAHAAEPRPTSRR
jgi:cytidylate kinase/pantoate ligase/cytidylate kinase